MSGASGGLISVCCLDVAIFGCHFPIFSSLLRLILLGFFPMYMFFSRLSLTEVGMKRGAGGVEKKTEANWREIRGCFFSLLLCLREARMY